MSLAKSLSITVLGRGAWGSTLQALWQRQGHRVVAWSRADGVDPAALLPGCDLVVAATALAGVEGLARRLAPAWPAGLPLLSCSKGLDLTRLATPSQLWRQHLPAGTPVLVLSGPNLAEELAQGLPAASVLASDPDQIGLARRLQGQLNGQGLRLYTNCDPIGTEAAGALKNVMALAAGICDGLGLGANAKASLLCRGLAEMGVVVEGLGGRSTSLYGLAGLGDLLATANSHLSRNYRCGLLLAEGLTEAEALERIAATVEGSGTARAALALGRRHGWSLPICEQVVAVLEGRCRPLQAVQALMERDLRPEVPPAEPAQPPAPAESPPAAVLRAVLVEAFSDGPSRGNGAAVVLLEAPLPDAVLQGLARSFRQSETAFLLRQQGQWHLRWFTPSCEVPLCGHATLAATLALGHWGLLAVGEDCALLTRSGPLAVQLRRLVPAMAELVLPSSGLIPAPPPAWLDQGLQTALGATAEQFWTSPLGYRVALLPDGTSLQGLDGFAAQLQGNERQGLVVMSALLPTADQRPAVAGQPVVAGRPADYDLRFFAPGLGISEDPVTGSAHALVAPYWLARLGREQVVGWQSSASPGGMVCSAAGSGMIRLLGTGHLLWDGSLHLGELGRADRSGAGWACG